MYVVEPGESVDVNALTNPNGLKIGIVYDAVPESEVLLYQRFTSKNKATLTITHVSAGDISTFGGSMDAFFLSLLLL